MRDIAPLLKDRLYYQLPQPYDTGTYYVRAVVKDLVSNSILGTYDLDSLGNQAFSKAWTTPPDPSGQGRSLLVTYTVYDDAYITPSANYGIQAEYLRIIQPWTLSLGGVGGSFGGSFDYGRILKPHTESSDEIKKILQDALLKIEGLALEIRDNRDFIVQNTQEVAKHLNTAKDLHAESVRISQKISDHEKQRNNEHRESVGNDVFSKLSDMSTGISRKILDFYNLVGSKISNIESRRDNGQPSSKNNVETSKKSVDTIEESPIYGKFTSFGPRGIYDILNHES